MSISGVTSTSSNYELNSIRSNSKQPPAKPSADEMVTKMTEELGLSSDQAAQIKKIMEDFDAQAEKEMSANQSSTQKTDTDKANTMKATMDKLNKSIMSVLSTDQQTKFQTILDNMQSQRQNNNPTVYQSDGVYV